MSNIYLEISMYRQKEDGSREEEPFEVTGAWSRSLWKIEDGEEYTGADYVKAVVDSHKDGECDCVEESDESSSAYEVDECKRLVERDAE